MVGYEKHKDELAKLGARIYAGSVDDEVKAAEVAAELSYPVAFGVPKAVADSIGSFWEDRRSIFQPAEFILDATGKVLNSLYVAGPIGRMAAEETVRYLTMQEKRRLEAAGG